MAVLTAGHCGPVVTMVEVQRLALFVCVGMFNMGFSKLVPPPGCTCTEEPDEFDNCITSSGHTCPDKTCADGVCWVHCISQDVMDRLNMFQFQGVPKKDVTRHIPCLAAQLGPMFSPCFFPEVTEMYAQALASDVYKQQPALTIKIRANVFDRSGLGDKSKSFTKHLFEESVAKLNANQVWPYLKLVPIYNSRKPSKKDWDWLRAPGKGIRSADEASIKFLYDFFGVPGHAPSEFLEVFYLPMFDSVGYAHNGGVSGNRRTFPGVVLLRETAMVSDLETSWHNIAHEMGHVLGLFHTMEGVEIQKMTGSACKKCAATTLVDQRLTGDFINDTVATGSYYADDQYYITPASVDYKTCTMTMNSSGFCATIPSGRGNMKNLMSYDEESCRTEFTPMQLARMRCFVDQDFSRRHVQDASPGLVFLSVGISVNCSVELRWLPPVSEVWCEREGCFVSRYKVERRCDGATQWTSVGQSQAPVRQFEDSDIMPGWRCEYRVKAVCTDGGTERAAVAKETVVPGMSSRCSKPPAPPSHHSSSPKPEALPSPPGPKPKPRSSPASGRSTQPGNCIGAKLDKFGNCVCNTKSAHACAGTMCKSGSGMSWYPKSCASCRCHGPGPEPDLHPVEACLGARLDEMDNCVCKEGNHCEGPQSKCASYAGMSWFPRICSQCKCASADARDLKSKGTELTQEKLFVAIPMHGTVAEVLRHAWVKGWESDGDLLVFLVVCSASLFGSLVFCSLVRGRCRQQRGDLCHATGAAQSSQRLLADLQAADAQHGEFSGFSMDHYHL